MLALLTGCARIDPYLKQVKPLVRGDVPVIAGTLAGGPWLVEDINGGGVIDNARLDLTFADGRVSGRSGCNSYSGPWQERDGATLLGPIVSTQRGCAAALMMMEGKFIAVLEAARTVTFDETGAAFLKAPDGRVIRIRRELR